jgi:hypothetical protein
LHTRIYKARCACRAKCAGVGAFFPARLNLIHDRSAEDTQRAVGNLFDAWPKVQEILRAA